MSHSASLALASALFTIAAPFQVRPSKALNHYRTLLLFKPRMCLFAGMFDWYSTAFQQLPARSGESTLQSPQRPCMGANFASFISVALRCRLSCHAACPTCAYQKGPRPCLCSHVQTWPCSVLLHLCWFLQAVLALLPSSRCLPEGMKATASHFSSDAYVQMALHGYSLRLSVTTASQLLHRHHRRMRDCQGAAHAAILPGKVSNCGCDCSSYCHCDSMSLIFLKISLEGYTSICNLGVCNECQGLPAKVRAIVVHGELNLSS